MWFFYRCVSLLAAFLAGSAAIAAIGSSDAGDIALATIAQVAVLWWWNKEDKDDE